MRTDSAEISLRFSGQTAKPSPYTRARSNRAVSGLEVRIDAVRPNSSVSQQERNYNPESKGGQIGLIGKEWFMKALRKR